MTFNERLFALDKKDEWIDARYSGDREALMRILNDLCFTEEETVLTIDALFQKMQKR